MEGLDILGAMDGMSKPKKGAVAGGGVGALVGLLFATFTGKHGRGIFGSRATLPFLRKSVPRVARIAAGAVLGGAAGAGLGFGVGTAIEHKDNAALPAAKPGKAGAPGALPGKKAA